MIIVSQDETSIINFDNIEEIYVSGKFISVNYSLNNNECIAEFKTEERAKVVLQEIIAVHQASKMFMATKGVLTQEEMCKAMIEQRKSIFKYEMPKE